MRIPAVLASLPTVRQGFSDCYIYVQLDTVTSLHSMTHTQLGSVTDMCVNTIDGLACDTTRFPPLLRLRAGVHCYEYTKDATNQKGGFRYCYAYVWATPPYPPSFSSSYYCD
jgi:hypothetical protein